MSQARYAEQLKALSDRLVEIQRPILLLDAIKWPQAYETQFLASGGTRLPAADRAFYEAQPLRFDAGVKRAELRALRADIRRRLGPGDRLGRILSETAEQYERVVELLQQRGRAGFLTASRALYGSARDHLRGDRKTLIELGDRLCGIFSLPAAARLAHAYPKEIEASDAVAELQRRLGGYFGDWPVNVELSDGIVSDASAGGDRIKINSYARFSELDLRVLEVHEGWVHVGTTLNGRGQPWASWLSVGSPRITAIQEGLAVLIETLTFSSFPDRARRISDRVVAIDLAERGADFIEVYRFFLERGLSEQASYKVAQRVFRGGMVEGGACFTKDLSYVRGFVETVNFIKSAILAGVPEILPMLFVGKVTLDDLPVLYEYALEGLIVQPAYLPPMFRDLNGLYTWFGFSSGMSLVNLGRVQSHFERLFQQLPQFPSAEACEDNDSDQE
ncbi:flavohemoglobin expression-modulating QEGLA motif protein [Marinobacterium arenosum]|uniref:flavohemoglobin expression-modulating QEGLA motif protein n=1 Tax=Marinobacterium arenosum TaxID=2862496 RepID=UPI001C96B16C|nr:flavohemoglobin expression-modulating QEGLA motif protein [Marinobacterium arenosum]MBY4677242.1 flavohemoglobin expression-modulating QEGLA motif protein [Marinobacterium arenosum]